MQFKMPKFGFKSKKRDNAAGFFGRKLSFISHKLSFISDKLSTINNKLFKKRINYQLSIFGKKLVINYKLLIIVGILVLSGVGGTLALNGFFGGGGDIPEDTMTRGLAGYWSFDEGGGSIARDASGNNNHGTLANGPKWTQGKNGSALQFDGKDDYVNCGNSSSLDITDEITVEAWVKPDMAKNADIVSRYSYSGPTNNGGYILRLWNDGKFYFVTLNDSQGGISANANMKKWNHVVATYDADGGTNNMKLYVNGLLANQTTRANAIKSITQNLKIGAFSYYYDGMVDSVKIYNRALSEAEVRYHYNHGGPVAHWDMDEGSGAKINDKSGNGNDGTLVNGPTWTQGKYGSALSFDGVDDYVDAGNQQNLQITGPITITAWVKTSNVTSYNGIVTKYYAENGKRGFALEFNPFNPTGGGLRFIISRDGTSTSIVSTNEVSINEWEHIAATYDGSTMKLYVDGILKSNANYDAGIYNTSEKLFLGRNVGYSSLNGLLDDIKIYDYARTEEEIRLDYNAGMAAHLGPSGKTCSEDPASCMDYGLVGNWDMDEGTGSVLNDNSGNNNHGTLTNGPKWTQGKSGGALSFNGNNSYVDVAENSSLILASGGSAEAWIRIGSFSPGYDNTILMKGDGASWPNLHYALLESSGGDKIIFAVSNGTDSLNTDGPKTPTLLANKWYHIIVTWDASQKCIYLNGILSQCVSSTIMPKDTMSGCYVNIGRSHNTIHSGTYYFDGEIDDVRIYNRALSEEEVRYHYNQGGPVGYWDMDEGSGLTINDKSGNGNDGTISGATWTEGKYGSALSFDGVNDVVNAGNGASLNITKEITVGLWIKRNNLDTVVNRGIIAKDGVGGYVLSLNYGTADHKITYVSPNVGTAKTVSTIDDTEWHYVACTVNESENALKLYIDGKLDASYAKIGTLAANATSLLIGRRSDYFNGLIDDVRIYDYARTEEEIRLDYNAGMATHLGPSGKTCSEDPASCMDYGLVGNWDMDEGGGSVINDNSGNNNHGTLTNGPKWTQGKSGSALQFDGKDDYVSVASNTNLNMGANQDFTIETWIKYSNNPSYHIVAGKYCDIITAGYWLDVQGNNIRLRVSDAGGNYVDTITTAQYNDNKWHHVMAIADRDGLAYIYIDGNQVKSNDISSENGDTGTGAFSIGRPYDRNYAYFNGQIDELRIYNRALSEAEVRYHYNHGGPVAHWDMDEGSGSTINDKSGNGNDGTISGATWTQGKYGSALSFDGVDDYVDAGNDSSLNITDVVTIEAWVNFASFAGTQHIIKKGEFNSDGWYWRWNNSDIWSITLNKAGSTKTYASGETIPLSEWTQLVSVIDNNNLKIYWYKNGKYIKTTDLDWAYTGNVNTNLYIGKQSIYHFNGVIDDVKIYNYARTEEEIRLDYNAGMATHLGPSGKTCSEDPASCMDYGLVGNWDMDEGSGSVINDNSGNNNNCSLVNGTKWSTGKSGSALYFDGEDDYANCSAAVDDISSVAGTVELWAKPESGIGYAFHSNANARTYVLRGSGAFVVYKGDPMVSIAFPATSLGEWHHLVLTWDNGVFWGYQDGVLINSKNFSSTTAASIVKIGQHNSAGRDNCFDGDIDGVKIYNRALSEAEVRYHYNQGGPVAHWDMDEGEGTRAFDSSGNNNHGTISGATWVEGKYGSALSFDGADDYVGCGTSSSLDIANSMTASAWIYPKTLGEGSAGHIVGRGGTAGWCFYVYTSNSLKLLSGAGIQVTSEVNSITLNQWQYVTVVYDKQNVRFFVNGVEKGVTAETDSILNTGSCIIGARTTAGDFDFNGYLDDVRVYNYARTAEEIRLDYQQGVATHLK